MKVYILNYNIWHNVYHGATPITNSVNKIHNVNAENEVIKLRLRLKLLKAWSHYAVDVQNIKCFFKNMVVEKFSRQKHFRGQISFQIEMCLPMY